MIETTYQAPRSNIAMILSFVLAVVAMLGTVSVISKSYNELSQEAETKLPVPKPPTKTGEKPVETENEVSVGSAITHSTTKPVFWFSLLQTVVLTGLGVVLLVRSSSKSSDFASQQQEEKLWTKLSFFLIISLLGFFLVVCLAIPYTWIYSSELMSRVGWTNWRPWLIVGAYVLGLGAMFCSLLAIKSEERNSAGLRRWIYGYNAFLGALLFLAILGVVNAWFALYGPEPSDWTQTNIYSLSPATKKLVKSLEKPVHAYVLMEEGYLLNDVQNTLNNCKKLNTQLEVTEIPLVQKNVKEIDALLKKYEVLRDASGLAQGILLVQDANSDKPLSTFVKQDDLEEVTGDPRMGGGQRYYKGETAIYSALREFRQEKKKVTIYFTQDSGELSIDEASARGRGTAQVSRSIMNVKRGLEKAGYIVKPLNLSEQDVSTKDGAKVPDDALAVVVADPLRMTPQKAAILEAYLRRPKKDGVEPGKLIAFFDPHFGSDNKVTPTGLESVLGSYGVQVGQDVIYSLVSNDVGKNPTNAMIAPLPQLGIDPEIQDTLAGLIVNASTEIELRECRSIKTIPAQGGYDVKGLLYAVSPMVMQGPSGRRMVVWSESVNHPKPEQYVLELKNSRELYKKDFPQVPPSLAVTVRDRGQQMPQQNPMMPPPQGKLGDPRMVIFGDATFLTDSETQVTGDLGSRMLVTCLAWIRGKPELDSGDVQPKERKAYSLKMSSETLSRIRWLPPLWLLLAVIALGVGVGILRRK